MPEPVHNVADEKSPSPDAARQPSFDVATLLDTVLPGPDSALDRFSRASHSAISKSSQTRAGRPITYLLRGNEWLGHPAHPVVIAVPIGAWVVSSWYDVRSLVSKSPRDEHAADAALRVGVAGAVVAAVTGAVQYLDTRDAARRETAVHAALNNVALGLYVASWALRRGGRRPLARKMAAAGLGLVAVSGYLGGDIAFRHGVGVRPQALRDLHRPAAESSATPIDTGDAHHR